ncbi:BrnA antitoxin family protein [Castellaniella sp.]|uniref:BrnA antitoxin family protein n=1 Tax=Castellaniella sp. TaxID=1955812 RepID=UPI002B002BE3|nr:BrnA antitoxin family protein [Castellaniella sp.]
MPSSDLRAKARARAMASLRNITPEEDAAITRAAEEDADNPPIKDMAGFQPVRRGRKPGTGGVKKLTTLRLDPDVIAHFRATGEGWQSRINAALRKVAGL